MSVQLTYDEKIAKQYAGGLADNNPKRTVTYIAEGGAIPYGRAVQPGASDDQAVIGTTTATSLYSGIAIRVHNNENPLGGVSESYPEGDLMAVMEEGSLFIDLVNTGAKGDPIYSVDADGTIGAGTAAAGQTQIPGGSLEETMAAAGIAKIRLRSQ
ncbi:MAG: hypothetical protein KAT00_11625 [Planctomycetes bacterium]|nr:hypothetical protein [Planctomycetota bacterium]